MRDRALSPKLWAGALFVVAFAACTDGSDPATASCADDAPLDLVFTEYGHTDQESSAVMGLHPDGSVSRVVPDDDYALRPALSPDGSQVAFISHREDTSEGASDYDLYTINSDGTDERAVELDVRAGDPSWSPDGEWIVFVGNYASDDGGIYKIRPDGEDLEKIVSLPEPLRPHSPVMPPDAKQIAWAQWDISDEAGARVIRVANVDGSDVRTLAEVGGAEDIDWSPDGKSIATSSAGLEGRAVYLVDVGSGEQEQVAQDAMGGRWNADGTELLYTLHPDEPNAQLVARDMGSGEEERVSNEIPQSFSFNFDIDPLPCVRQ